MPRRSAHTDAILQKIAERKRLRNESSKNPAPPLMQEKLRSRDMANRVKNMSPRERQAWVEQVGIEEALKVAQRIQKNS